MNITLVCEESFEGIMTAVYDGWVLMNQGHRINIHPGENYAPTFFSEFIPIKTNKIKAEKVAASIRIKISYDAYSMVYKTCMHFDESRADAVFEFLKIAYPAGAKVTKMLGNPAVMRVMELSRKVSNEAHAFREFIRFEELKGNILFSRIEPKCDVISLIYSHFQNRYPEENWIIYDVNRKKAALHQYKSNTILVNGQDLEELTADMQCSDEYVDLWKVFFDAIAIESRINPKCQQNHMPKWYRKHITEV